jgi:Pyruvate/2-oxoacid:ferredoxin oxidoreductase gamma subunit
MEAVEAAIGKMFKGSAGEKNVAAARIAYECTRA